MRRWLIVAVGVITNVAAVSGRNGGTRHNTAGVRVLPPRAVPRVTG